MGRTDKPYVTFDVNDLPVLPDPTVIDEHRTEVTREFLKGCDFEPTAAQVLAFAEAYAEGRRYIGDNHHNAAACPYCNPEYEHVGRFVKCLEFICKRRPDGSLVYGQHSMAEFAQSELQHYKEQKQNAS